MNQWIIKFVKNRKKIADCHQSMMALWPEIKLKDFVRRVSRQFKEGYKLAVLEVKGDIQSVIGFRISNILSHGKSIYIEDFATKTSAQSKGYGNYLFDWACQYARSQGCEWVHLDCRVQNSRGQRFYARKGMKVTSKHFGMSLKQKS